MQPRYYQRDAVDSLYKYFEHNDGNPLIILPPGCGKSLVMALFIQEATQNWPDTRIIVATHSKELVEQDYLEFMQLCPFADAGLYSAGLKRRDTRNSILFCGIQSVYNKAHLLGKCDILIVDEAHTIPPDGEGMWQTFVKDMREMSPHFKVVGLTATDYRMKSGLLTTGEGALFTDVCYEYPLLQAFKDGYLCPIVPTTMATKYDISAVRTTAGEYNQGDLDTVFNVDEKTMAALDEVEAYGSDRKSWLIFAQGNKHAYAIHEELKKRGYAGGCVTQETSITDRANTIAALKSGEYRYIVNNQIFTTGFNVKGIDLIADFGATKSPGLHVQKLGRGTRCVGADIHESIENGKENCVLLDFARNVDFHGPLDQIRGKDKEKSKGGEAPMRLCDGTMPNGDTCNEVLFASIRKCYRCGKEFDFCSADFRTTGGDSAVISTQNEPEWVNVLDAAHFIHKKADKKYSTLRVKYVLMTGIAQEWICFNHPRGSYAHNKAFAWHNKTGADFYMPDSVEEALAAPYPKPDRILVQREGKYMRVLDYDYSVDRGKFATGA